MHSNFSWSTLAFKDFGGRFMAQTLAAVRDNNNHYSNRDFGDTGAAVARTFYGLENINVVFYIQKVKLVHCKKNCSNTLEMQYSYSSNQCRF